eukprot:TRINITY_DN9157_c1_g1_i1.p3 TRINITY_DN9157_c1_g1~~TRINITY_DN9157_c1_g1_i1.p3  ORF type:complete len:235 (-),score=-9.46 TRINITY_DN9157_c1_g1_i1:634-1338(-)
MFLLYIVRVQIIAFDQIVFFQYHVCVTHIQVFVARHLLFQKNIYNQLLNNSQFTNIRVYEVFLDGSLSRQFLLFQYQLYIKYSYYYKIVAIIITRTILHTQLQLDFFFEVLMVNIVTIFVVLLHKNLAKFQQLWQFSIKNQQDFSGNFAQKSCQILVVIVILHKNLVRFQQLVVNLTKKFDLNQLSYNENGNILIFNFSPKKKKEKQLQTKQQLMVYFITCNVPIKHNMILDFN